VKSAEERIKKLARAQSLDDEDAARQLEAVRPAPVTERRESLLANPFARYGGAVTSAAGVAIALVSLLASRWGLRFDGTLDLHTTGIPVPLRTAVADQLVAIPLTALVFWVFARLATRSVRFVDVLGVVGVARGPAVLLAIPVALFAFRHAPDTGPTPTSPALVFVIAAALAGLGSQIYLLFVGFRTASGLRGGGLTWRFIAALVLAEIASKVALSMFA
jgi:hypothetical protein